MRRLSKKEFSETLKRYGWVFTGDKEVNLYIWTKAFTKSITVISLNGDKDDVDSIFLDVSNNEGETITRIEIERCDISKILVTDDKLEIYKTNPFISIGDL